MWTRFTTWTRPHSHAPQLSLCNIILVKPSKMAIYLLSSICYSFSFSLYYNLMLLAARVEYHHINITLIKKKHKNAYIVILPHTCKLCCLIYWPNWSSTCTCFLSCLFSKNRVKYYQMSPNFPSWSLSLPMCVYVQ